MMQPNQHAKVLPVLDVIALTLSAALIVILAENGVHLVNRLVLRRLAGTTTGFLWIVPLYYGLRQCPQDRPAEQDRIAEPGRAGRLAEVGFDFCRRGQAPPMGSLLSKAKTASLA